VIADVQPRRSGCVVFLLARPWPGLWRVAGSAGVRHFRASTTALILTKVGAVSAGVQEKAACREGSRPCLKKYVEIKSVMMAGV